MSSHLTIFEYASRYMAVGVRSSMPTVLVVEPSPSDVRLMTSVLSGFKVTVAREFGQARGLLRTQIFDLLITELRLGEYNGLQLVLAAQAMHSTVALVTSATVDPVLRDEAERLDATFVPKPLAPRELTAAILRTITRPLDLAKAPSRHSHQTPPRAHAVIVRPPFERRRAERRVARDASALERRRHERRTMTLASVAAAR
jgi:DNA-binding response OmpR family regulator